ncbi:MAG TPA: hypothetical protein VFA32_17480 [Dehalococcoidia bacterium]|nr:hypothetical protein [Dehalococcoidia bacterium]
MPNEAGGEAVERVRSYAREAGRDPSEIGAMGRLRLPGKQPEDWLDEVKAWQEMGATHVSVEARRGVLASVDGHIDAIREAKDAIGI